MLYRVILPLGPGSASPVASKEHLNPGIRRLKEFTMFIAIIVIDRLLKAVDDGLELYVEVKVRQPRLERWLAANPEARLIHAPRARVHLDEEEALLAAHGHIISKQEGEARFVELSQRFPKGWATPAS